MTDVAQGSVIDAPAIISPTLTIALTPEDSARLAAVARGRQIDAIALAQMLLHDSLTALLPLSPVDIESLEKLYTFREPSEVLQFLEQYPFLVALALEAHEHIRKEFPDCPLYLKISIDPEIPSWDMLRIGIDTDIKDPEEAIDRIERIDDDWWLDAEGRSQGKMFLNLH